MRANHRLLVLSTIVNEVVTSLYLNIKFLKNYTEVELMDNNVFRIVAKKSKDGEFSTDWKFETLDDVSEVEEAAITKAVISIKKMLGDTRFKEKTNKTMLELFNSFMFVSLEKDMMLPLEDTLECYVKDLDLNSEDEEYVDRCSEIFKDVYDLTVFSKTKEREMLYGENTERPKFVSMKDSDAKITILAITLAAPTHTTTAVMRVMRTTKGFVPIETDCIHIIVNEANSQNCDIRSYQVPYSDLILEDSSNSQTAKFVETALESLNERSVYSATSESDKLIYASILNITSVTELKFTSFKSDDGIPEEMFDFDRVATKDISNLIQSAILAIQSNAKTMYMIDMQIKFKEVNDMADKIMGGLLPFTKDKTPMC